MKEKSIEIRLRNTLRRRYQYVLRKSRRRDQYAPDYGGYWIVDPDGNHLVAGGEWGMSLDEVEEWIKDMEGNG